MVLNQDNIKDLRALFCNAVIKIFGNAMDFLEFIENEECSVKYDCFIDCDGENYIINRETGEYINWYKFNHIGRAINISVLSNRSNISEWLERFLVEFKGEEALDMDLDKWHTLYSWLVDIRAANAGMSTTELGAVRMARRHLLDEILKYMNELEQEEHDEA